MKATTRKTKYGFVGVIIVTDGNARYTINTDIIRLTRLDALTDAQWLLQEMQKTTS